MSDLPKHLRAEILSPGPDKPSHSSEEISPLKKMGSTYESESLMKTKKDIIGCINTLVNQFNLNNKLIKDQNKTQKTEKALNDLIDRNQTIQDECDEISTRIEEAKGFGQQIQQRLE